MKGRIWTPASRKAKRPPPQDPPLSSPWATCRSPLALRPATDTHVPAGEALTI
ncbi:hypothetical protein E2C01_075585 [Portunus trituberculatus]|uniref:Uncharacterized protein n=1 Tax=Portunus trituberculatus TaxID=210409 RepID=A0A5B7IFF4_PORTR|nr:hypothetical protein [Portunus trituberculatus]